MRQRHRRPDIAIGRRVSHAPAIAAALFGLIQGSVPVRAAAPATGWLALATHDLAAMRALIQDNHPGPVDDQNPGFEVRLDAGASRLHAQALAARTGHDDRQVLLTYANGFADDHLAVRFDRPERELWPGFLTRTEAVSGPTRVMLVDDAPGVAPGDVLLGCGAGSASGLLAERVLRPLANPAQPQRLILTSPWLTVVDADDAAGRTPTCRFAAAAGPRTVPVRWRPIDAASLSRRIEQASGIIVPPPGLNWVGDVWLISLPSFTWTGPDAARMRAMVATLRGHASALHAARHVVIDLRGNGGGNSQWGDDVAAALWGRAPVDASMPARTGPWTGASRRGTGTPSAARPLPCGPTGMRRRPPSGTA